MRSALVPAAALCALLFTTSACDFNAAQEAFDDLNIVLALDDVETTASGQIVDALTGELIEREVTLTFAGPNAADVIDSFSDPIAEMKATGGLASFGFAASVQPSPDAPAEIRVIASAPGYRTGVARVAVNAAGTM